MSRHLKATPPGKSRRAAGYLAALLATVIFAGNFIAARALADNIPPCELNFWRWVTAFLALLPFSLRHLRQDWQIFRREFGYFSLMAILGVTLMNAFIYKAGQTTESLNMALIMPATPAVILVLARIMYNEPINFTRLCGMCIAITGIVFLVCRGDYGKLLQLDFNGGDLWTLAGMFCFAFYSIFMRKRPHDVSSAGFNLLIFGLGLIYCLPCVAFEMYYLPLPTFSWPVISGILYAGLGCSAIAFWLWTVAVDRIGPVTAGVIYYSLPLYAAIMAILILGEEISAAQIIGGCLIIGGIVLATVQPKKPSWQAK